MLLFAFVGLGDADMMVQRLAEEPPPVFAVLLIVCLVAMGLLCMVARRCSWCRGRRSVDVGPLEAWPDRVYLASSGSKVHLHRDCRTLVHARQVRALEFCKVCCEAPSQDSG